MKLSNESIFISALRSFFNTMLGTIGIFLAIFIFFMLIAILSPSDYKDENKNKMEILPDLNGSTKVQSLSSPVILQLDINNVIGKSPITSEEFKYQLIDSRKSFLKNNRVKGILLHINSPGGAATDSDEIYRLLQEYKTKYKVPVFAFVDGICASGGFYIACASNKIYASPMSMIGSVGALLGPFFNVSKTLENWGINTLTLTQGKDKDLMNPFRPWSKEEDKTLIEINEAIYDRFVSIVATSRNLDKDKIINEYGAHVFSCQKAKDIGYIDEANSNYDQAMIDLLKEAGIDSTKPYQVVTIYPKKTWYQCYLNQTRSFIQTFIKDFLLSVKYMNAN